MAYDAVEIVTQELRTHGVTEWTVEPGNHPKIRFIFNGKPLMFVVAGTSSDTYRGPDNCLTELRRVMGVKKVAPPKRQGPKRQRNRTEAKVRLADLSFSVRPDPFTSLVVVADRLKADIAKAWQNGEMAFLSGGSGAAPGAWPVHLSQAYVAGWWAMHALVHEISD